ncbi:MULTISPECIES: sugar transferase [unclassified Aureimonas]|uniref:sugar transferase n=1 Tax=unclassified Aureimonas TaxID=2615206 RepID=UPI0006F2DB9A|nr:MULTISPECIES: sugar transferase [unclassified Aureimonas]KQT55353.1 lipid carrier--UDP-N-acetylgalactosaminyltransferase [Aureimonas sp. Leaf427]KQT71144.1 lipid carrier--UDP-N-acetylgalactosaminyltransferase [Aureimonas sp. Leaf460]
MKRLFDVTASLAGLVVLGWLIGVLAFAIRRNSPGPGLLAQERVGRGGRVFTCYKLRTMHVGTASLGTHEHKGVAHITGIGRFLRRSKLDELPQLWNVLKGEMSLVGPRPCLPVQTVLIEARRRRGVLDVRPGITGKAQVMGVDMSEPERLAEIDASYIADATFFGDLALILRTVTGR